MKLGDINARKPLLPRMEPRSERRRTIRMIGRRVVGDETRLVAYRETWLTPDSGPNIFRCGHVTLNATTRRLEMVVCPNCTPPPPMLAGARVQFGHKHELQKLSFAEAQAVTANYRCTSCGALVL
jgi:hypothetical protein